ncbi:MAG: alpha-amylase, partial [Bacteroidales bacterium]|nr:alpha-amylase [Bacteroidales bacterium]
MKERIYQLLPRLWGSGKFSSIDTKSLEYLHTLGVDFIWLTGIIHHASRWGTSPQKVVKGDAGSPYAITDYYDVNPYLADCPENRMAEFENLL